MLVYGVCRELWRSHLPKGTKVSQVRDLGSLTVHPRNPLPLRTQVNQR